MFFLAQIIFTFAAAHARDLHVDPAKGDDTSDGVAQPVKSIKQAIRLALPGDTIHLEKTTYYESAEFGKKSGEPGKPIVLEGHGAVLEGSERVTGKDWEHVSAGLYRKVHLLPKIEPFVLQRWFMVWGDKLVHMDRTSKGRLAPFKQPADLQIDEWTYVADEEAFYIRIARESDLDTMRIRYPARSSGVAIGGAAHLVVRDLTCTHVSNDGFNVHGSARDCRFENIQAIGCGDDGFSAHEDAECEIDGFRSIGNSTGFTDINSSKTHYQRVYVGGCLAFDFLFQGDGEHSVRDAVIQSFAQTPFGVGSPDPSATRSCQVQLEDLYFVQTGKAYQVRLPVRTSVAITRSSFLNFPPFESKGELTLKDCVVSLEYDMGYNSLTVGADMARLMKLGLFSH
ncbi:MAG TPA: hypothetical protein VGO11_03430 [Chthoniobacteraceae bacterium]|nr:hypothetical protein [Chthoniobacteraceae bacterium]